jgi:hypothetical protein
MKSINLIDNQFSHGLSLGSGDLPIPPKNFLWDRTLNSASYYVFITEASFHNPQVNFISPERRIAFMVEPVSINPGAYEWIKANYMGFKYVLSHDIEFNKQIPNALYYPFGGCLIMPSDRIMHPKSKFISIIASEKRQTEGHRLRHEIIEKYSGKYDIDVFGRGYNKVEYKLEALKDYCYSIVIENEFSKGWFTEKLIDCLVTGTIPIYAGAPDIYNYFSGTKGFINFKFLDEFLSAGKQSCMNHYKDCLSTTKRILDVASEYTCTEDWLYTNYPQLFS